jgi:hypothetical protein
VSFKLDEILEFDDSLHEDFSKIGERFMPVLMQSNFPATMQSLIGLMTSTNSIKLGMYDLVEKCDTHLYVVKILHRTLLEQFLRFEFICQRFLEEGSEEAGYEYRKYSKISETLAYISASQVAATMAGKSTDDIVLKKLKKKHPELEITKRSLSDITGKWKHRSIIRYLTSNAKQSKDEYNYLFNIIPEYAELSSFIHGGTSAEEYYHEIFDSSVMKAEMTNMAANACLIAATVKAHLLAVVVKIDSSFEDDRNRIMNNMVKFSYNLHNKSMPPIASESSD